MVARVSILLRYSESGTDEDNNKKLVKEVALLNQEGRKAHYACAIVLARDGKGSFFRAKLPVMVILLQSRPEKVGLVMILIFIWRHMGDFCPNGAG